MDRRACNLALDTGYNDGIEGRAEVYPADPDELAAYQEGYAEGRGRMLEDQATFPASPQVRNDWHGQGG